MPPPGITCGSGGPLTPPQPTTAAAATAVTANQMKGSSFRMALSSTQPKQKRRKFAHNGACGGDASLQRRRPRAAGTQWSLLYPGPTGSRRTHMPQTRLLAASVLAAALSSAAPALATAAADGSGLEIGARLGYGFAAGRLGAVPNGTDNDVGDFVSGQWPLWLDAGYRFTGDLYVGGFFTYGFGSV